MNDKMIPAAGQYWTVLRGSSNANGKGIYIMGNHPNSHLMFVCFCFELDKELLIHKSDFLLGYLEYVG